MPEFSTHPSSQIHVLIVAGGRGSRFGSSLPKQYACLGGMSVLRRTVLAFVTHPKISQVLIVIHPDDHRLYEKTLDGLELNSPAEGGTTRQHSVANGLAALRVASQDIVLIHDAARPLVSAQTIDRCIEALSRSDGAIAAIPVRDTIKRESRGLIGDTIDRTALWRAQTPQAFRFGAIVAAHDAAKGLDLSDDAAVAERSRMKVELVMGDEDNFKITTMEDLERAERVLSGRRPLDEFRTGSGFDVHQLVPGDHVWINGVRIDHDRTLLGHSDADVGLHALTDAVLGAIGGGDIGDHFPPSDERWRGAPSHLFLAHAAELVRAKGGRIVHCDLTIICERPKIGPHRQAMTMRVAEILGISNNRVSIKATTTEKLGFTGRGEGIAAQAIATVALPADACAVVWQPTFDR